MPQQPGPLQLACFASTRVCPVGCAIKACRSSCDELATYDTGTQFHKLRQDLALKVSNRKSHPEALPYASETQGVSRVCDVSCQEVCLREN